MTRTLLVAAALLTLSGCAAVRNIGNAPAANPYENPFYAKYLNTGSQLDAEISRTLEGLRQYPGSARLHNELGTLLVEKGFPKDAERELERAVDLDGRYYQAWHNLGLVRAGRGDEGGARRAFRRAVDIKPGHDSSLFELGLIEEKLRHTDRAIAYYAKAFRINPALLQVDVNPRILDSKLTHAALLHAYPNLHTTRSMQLQDAPILVRRAAAPDAASNVADPSQIITPAAPATDPAMQQAVPVAPATTISSPRTGSSSPRTRRPRPRRIEPQEERPVDPQPEPEPVSEEQTEEIPSFEAPPLEIPEDQVPEETGEEETEDDPPPPPAIR